MEATPSCGPSPRSDQRLGSVWLHRSLGICSYLVTTRSLSPSARALVTFAIMWAPYGGAESDELMVSFGMPRPQFLGKLELALAPEDSDSRQVRELKAMLRHELVTAWGADLALEAGPPVVRLEQPHRGRG